MTYAKQTVTKTFSKTHKLPEKAQLLKSNKPKRTKKVRL